MKKFTKLLSLLLVLSFVFLLVGCDSTDYKNAMALYEEGKYEEAIAIFTELGDYEDSAHMVEVCEEEWMYEKYSGVFSSLNGNVWFYNDGFDTVLYSVAFTDKEAVIRTISYDGNGSHATSGDSYEYIVDDESIVVGDNVLTIDYTLDGDKLSLDKKYYSIKKIDKALQGYWGYRDTSIVLYTVSDQEYIIRIKDGKIKYESASEAYGYNDGTYYYYGPYDGTYEITEEGMKADVHNGNFGFNIIDGKVKLMHYDHVCKTVKGFKGQDGYSF